MSDSPFVVNVTAETFQQQVIENSFKQPVLADFWAEWCNPCQMLVPVLTKLAEEYRGAFVLAKINTDEQQELAAQAGVRSLPTVKLFVDGQVVNEFMGALPESEVRRFLEPYLKGPADEVIAQAEQAFAEGREQEGLDLLNQALADNPDNGKLKISIARIAAGRGDYDGAQALLDSLSAEDKESDAARELQAQLKVARQLEDIGDPNELQQRIEQNPDDLEAMLKLSHYLTAQAQYEPAMELLLKIMQKDRQFGDDAGRQGLLNLFEILGNEHPLTKTYRRRMFTLLH
jgi:putative thioredoxin